MRIAFVSDVYWPRVNGLVVSIDAFKTELERLGHCVGVFTNQYSRDDARQDALAGRRGIHRFSSYPSPIYSPDEHQLAPHVWPDFFNALKHFKPDIVHVHTEFTAGQLGAFFARYCKVPLVMSSHTHYEFYINNYVPLLWPGQGRFLVRGLMWLIFRRAERLVVPSEHFRKTMVGYGLRAKRMQVIPTGLDAGWYQIDEGVRAAFLKEFAQDHPGLANKRLLLYVGRLGQEKNLSLLLDVLEKVLAKEPEAYLLVVGDGPYRHHFHHQAFKRGLLKHMHFTGYVDHAKLKYLYALAEVFVFPSRSETQGLVTIEAMASGTPVVAVGEMGTYFIMQGDNGGFMVPNDSQVFSEKVLLLLSDPVLRDQKSKEALAFSHRFSNSTMTKRLIAVYEDIKMMEKHVLPDKTICN